jgi:hypothetical protein
VSRGEGELLTVPKPRAVRVLSVYLAVKPVGEPDAGDRHVRLCVQRRLACSAGDKPAGVKVRAP